MPWRDRLLPASWRGVGFHLLGARTESGRRLHVHEFPRQDVGIVEDLGRKTPGMDVEGVLIGPDYDLQRARLQAALDQAGPGELSHPYAGLVQARVDSYTLTESHRTGGMVSVSIRFVPVGEPDRRVALTDLTGRADAMADVAAATATQRALRDYRVPESGLERTDAQTGLAEIRDALNGAIA